MNLQHRINAFIKLGQFLHIVSAEDSKKKKPNTLFFKNAHKQIAAAQTHNAWFTHNNIMYALKNWANALTQKHITKWLLPYTINEISSPQTIAIIMAGNIPLVGFHDFLSVLITGHNVQIKQSTNDSHLLPFLATYLEYVEPQFKNKIKFIKGKLSQFDAVIATGSNNTSRYFEYYFKKKPNIIRKNRTSIAILSGNETNEELQLLSKDIFTYFGLGCRNVSKLIVPKEYDFNLFFKNIYQWKDIINKNKYANNYDYNKAVYLMSNFNILDNGFLLLKEDEQYTSPIATIFFEYYNDKENLLKKINSNKGNLQCVVAKGFLENEKTYGSTQQPHLWDYADGIDTIDFLLRI